MAMKDTYSYTGPRLAAFKAFNAAAGTTAFAGSAIDTLGFNSVLFAATANYSETDTATYTLSMQDSDDNSTFTAVDDKFIIGPSAPLSGAANVQKIGYTGARRYVKLVVTPSDAATSTNVITVSALAILQSPEIMPTA